MYEQIGNIKLNLNWYLGTDLYSDGDIEDEILSIVKNHDKSEYNRIINEKKDWAVLYHLSQIRENIVNFLEFEPNSSVLEIGAGCGAVTGALSRKANKVTCIELSKKRSTINAYKNKECNNVEILVGNFTDIEQHLEEKFDYITLIGVFEYAASYISSGSPYEDFMKIICKHLKPNGKIIMAIENKLGLKYWAGCKEDHTGQFFLGLNNYEGIDTVRTFSKRELEDIFKQFEMEDIDFYYPYPDYKFPMRIYTDSWLPTESELNINMRNFDNDRLIIFDEAKVYDSLIREGVFPIVSNSFLIVAGKGEYKCLK